MTHDIQKLVRDTLEATVDIWGVDEEVWGQTLADVARSGEKEQYQEELWRALEDVGKGAAIGATSARDVVSALLRYEGVGAARCDMLMRAYGETQETASTWDYVIDGVLRNFDLSSDSTKLGVAALGGYGLATFLLPGLALLSLAGSTALAGGGLYSVVQSARAVAQCVLGDSAWQRKEALATFLEYGGLGLVSALPKALNVWSQWVHRPMAALRKLSPIPGASWGERPATTIECLRALLDIKPRPIAAHDIDAMSICQNPVRLREVRHLISPRPTLPLGSNPYSLACGTYFSPHPSGQVGVFLERREGSIQAAWVPEPTHLGLERDALFQGVPALARACTAVIGRSFDRNRPLSHWILDRYGVDRAEHWYREQPILGSSNQHAFIRRSEGEAAFREYAGPSSVLPSPPEATLHAVFDHVKFDDELFCTSINGASRGVKGRFTDLIHLTDDGHYDWHDAHRLADHLNTSQLTGPDAVIHALNNPILQVGDRTPATERASALMQYLDPRSIHASSFPNDGIVVGMRFVDGSKPKSVGLGTIWGDPNGAFVDNNRLVMTWLERGNDNRWSPRMGVWTGAVGVSKHWVKIGEETVLVTTPKDLLLAFEKSGPFAFNKGDVAHAFGMGGSHFTYIAPPGEGAFAHLERLIANLGRHFAPGEDLVSMV